MAASRHEARFRPVVEHRLEPGESIVAIARVWTSRPARLPALAARYRDEAVVTDRRLMVWTCGWWTGRPRRRVLADRLDQVHVTNESRPGRRTDGAAHIVTRIRVDHPGHRPITFDLGSDDESQRFARALLVARASAAST